VASYPKWKYRNHPEGFFQSTLVADAEVDAEVSALGYTDDPHEHGVEVVPYPAELTLGGTVMHHKAHGADANGNYAHGPAPTVPGVNGGSINSSVKV